MNAVVQHLARAATEAMEAMSNNASQAGDPASDGRDGAGRAPLPSCAIKSVALLLARHEIRKLRRWFDEFDRDILLPILLGEIALYNIGSLQSGHGGGAQRRKKDSTDLDDAEAGCCALRPCNAYSIAAATGLPRETVRRKIVRLVELGWIERRDNGHLFVTEAALTYFGNVLNSRELPEVIETADQARSLLAR